ncbi:MAG TPA: response regulator [Aquabacterium sp.]|mgnify:CR=1 FL=1|nr:response regulator [Aquabacterium sp.]
MPGVVHFGDFELRPGQRLLLHHGAPVQLGGRALDLLLLLVAQRQRVLSKRELIDHCWPDQAVEPNNLAVQIWALRRLLGADVIATVPGRGYQFVGVDVASADAAPTGDADAPSMALGDAAQDGLRLLLIDDHPLFREGLALALAQALPGVQVATCATPAEAQRLLAADADGIDLVLVDHRLAGGVSGLHWARALRQARPALAVALMSGADDTSLPARARDAGLAAFLPKTLDVTTLARVLQALQAGDTWFPPAAAAAPVNPAAGLTERQQQVVQLAAQGANSKAIGLALGISPATVRNHFAQIFERLGARSRAQAVQLLRRADGLGRHNPD